MQNMNGGEYECWPFLLLLADGSLNSLHRCEFSLLLKIRRRNSEFIVGRHLQLEIIILLSYYYYVPANVVNCYERIFGRANIFCQQLYLQIIELLWVRIIDVVLLILLIPS